MRLSSPNWMDVENTHFSPLFMYTNFPVSKHIPSSISWYFNNSEYKTCYVNNSEPKRWIICPHICLQAWSIRACLILSNTAPMTKHNPTFNGQNHLNCAGIHAHYGTQFFLYWDEMSITQNTKVCDHVFGHRWCCVQSTRFDWTLVG
jgi:hypothetical protein